MDGTSIISNPANARNTQPDSPQVPGTRSPIPRECLNRRGSQFDMFIWEISRKPVPVLNQDGKLSGSCRTVPSPIFDLTTPVLYL